MKNPTYKKILLMAIPSLRKGGSERVFSHIANNLDRDKYVIHVLVFNSSQIQFDLNADIHVIGLGKKGVLRGLPDFVKQIFKIKPDIVFTTLTHLNIIAGILSMFFSSIKFVCRESSVISANNHYQPNRTVFDKLIQYSYPLLDGIICQSKEMKNDMISNYKLSSSKITVINNPISVPRQEILNHFDNGEPITFITVGRLIESKGFFRILDILARLDFDFRYLIVGGGDLEKRLEKKISELDLEGKVIMTGLVNDVGKYYQQADIYLHGSHYEGFPNVLLEACAYGIPILTFDTLGVSEIVGNGVNGYVVPDNNHEQFIAQIKRMKLNRFDRKRIQEDIYNRFSTIAIIERYEQVLS